MAEKKTAAPETDGTATQPSYIKVKSNLPAKKDGGSQVALYEVNPAHPDGEVFIAGETVVEVAETSEVNRAIAEKRLVKV